MTSWLQGVAERVRQHGAAVRAVVVRAEGSTPREAGAAMLVTAQGTEGTIGGGTLEFEVTAAAQSIINSHPRADEPAWHRETRDYPLGPSLGQCCGGYVKVLFELFTSAESAHLEDAVKEISGRSALILRQVEGGGSLRLLTHRKDGFPDLPLNVLRVTRDMLTGTRASAAVLIGSKGASGWFVEPSSGARLPLYLYGAGHVGRALVRVLEDLPFDVTWIDTAADRFPAAVQRDIGAEDKAEAPGALPLPVPAKLMPLVAANPASAASSAPAEAFHLVMTHSHPLDLAICHTILKQGNSGFLGLIGSATKRARFIKRLRELGHAETAIERLTCPIGLYGLLGKEPAVIAVSVAAQLLMEATARKSASAAPRNVSGAAQ